MLPAALYRLTREPVPGGSDPNPVVISRTVSVTTSRQISAPFLCSECEKRFSENGERYVLAHCARPGQGFRLRGMLEVALPFLRERGILVYDADAVLKVDAIEKYIYFATSVFWRASARRWTNEHGERIADISLGNDYDEQFRQYLLGEREFPSNARIVVHVSSDDVAGPMVVFPCVGPVVDGKRRFKFYIPGILFVLFLDVPTTDDAGALNGKGRRLIWLCPWRNDSLFEGFVRMIRGSRPAGRLERQ